MLAKFADFFNRTMSNIFLNQCHFIFLQNSNNEEHYIVETNIKAHSIYKLTDINKAITNADIIVFLVAHKEFHNSKIKKDKIILDFCGINKY